LGKKGTTIFTIPISSTALIISERGGEKEEKKEKLGETVICKRGKGGENVPRHGFIRLISRSLFPPTNRRRKKRKKEEGGVGGTLKKKGERGGYVDSMTPQIVCASRTVLFRKGKERRGETPRGEDGIGKEVVPFSLFTISGVEKEERGTGSAAKAVSSFSP